MPNRFFILDSKIKGCAAELVAPGPVKERISCGNKRRADNGEGPLRGPQVVRHILSSLKFTDSLATQHTTNGLRPDCCYDSYICDDIFASTFEVNDFYREHVWDLSFYSITDPAVPYRFQHFKVHTRPTQPLHTEHASHANHTHTHTQTEHTHRAWGATTPNTVNHTSQ